VGRQVVRIRQRRRATVLSWKSFLDPFARLPVHLVGLPEILSRSFGGNALRTWGVVVLRDRVQDREQSNLYADIPWVSSLRDPDLFRKHLRLFQWVLLTCPEPELAKALFARIPFSYGSRLIDPQGNILHEVPAVKELSEITKPSVALTPPRSRICCLIDDSQLAVFLAKIEELTANPGSSDLRSALTELCTEWYLRLSGEIWGEPASGMTR
jgi:hypothetical protein